MVSYRWSCHKPHPEGSLSILYRDSHFGSWLLQYCIKNRPLIQALGVEIPRSISWKCVVPSYSSEIDDSSCSFSETRTDYHWRGSSTGHSSHKLWTWGRSTVGPFMVVVTPKYWEELQLGATMNFLWFPPPHLMANSHMTPKEYATAEEFVDELISLGVLKGVPHGDSLSINCPLFWWQSLDNLTSIGVLPTWKRGAKMQVVLGTPCKWQVPKSFCLFSMKKVSQQV